MKSRGRRSNKIDVATVEEKTIVQAEDFETSLQLFLRDCKIRNVAEDTLKFYSQNLTTVLRILEKQNVDTYPQKITPEIIKEKLILYMMNAGNKENTINCKLRALRAFMNFLEREGMITESPFHSVKLLRTKQEAVPTFNREQLRLILTQPDQNTFTGFRDYTIMLLMVETGVRVRELTDILVDDIRWEDNAIRIHGKNKKDRLVPIQTIMKRQLRKYVALRGELDTPNLFVNIDNGPLSKKRIQDMIAMYGRRAGIKGVRCSPHTFRHTFAKMAVQNGADVFALQAVLGHSSLEMVRHYVNLFSSDVFEKHKKFSPVESLY